MDDTESHFEERRCGFGDAEQCTNVGKHRRWNGVSLYLWACDEHAGRESSLPDQEFDPQVVTQGIAARPRSPYTGVVGIGFDEGYRRGRRDQLRDVRNLAASLVTLNGQTIEGLVDVLDILIDAREEANHGN